MKLSSLGTTLPDLFIVTWDSSHSQHQRMKSGESSILEPVSSFLNRQLLGVQHMIDDPFGLDVTIDDFFVTYVVEYIVINLHAVTGHRRLYVESVVCSWSFRIIAITSI